jgi:hypothetical protein
MMSFLMEAVVIAFTLGMVIGGVVAIHLMQPGRKAGGRRRTQRTGAGTLIP